MGPFYLPSLPHLFVCSTCVCLVQYIGSPSPPHTCVSFVLAERLGKQRHMYLPRVLYLPSVLLLFAKPPSLLCLVLAERLGKQRQISLPSVLLLFAKPPSLLCLAVLT